MSVGLPSSWTKWIRFTRSPSSDKRTHKHSKSAPPILAATVNYASPTHGLAVTEEYRDTSYVYEIEQDKTDVSHDYSHDHDLNAGYESGLTSSVGHESGFTYQPSTDLGHNPFYMIYPDPPPPPPQKSHPPPPPSSFSDAGHSSSRGRPWRKSRSDNGHSACPPSFARYDMPMTTAVPNSNGSSPSRTRSRKLKKPLPRLRSDSYSRTPSRPSPPSNSPPHSKFPISRPLPELPSSPPSGPLRPSSAPPKKERRRMSTGSVAPKKSDVPLPPRPVPLTKWSGSTDTSADPSPYTSGGDGSASGCGTSSSIHGSSTSTHVTVPSSGESHGKRNADTSNFYAHPGGALSLTTGPTSTTDLYSTLGRSSRSGGSTIVPPDSPARIFPSLVQSTPSGVIAPPPIPLPPSAGIGDGNGIATISKAPSVKKLTKRRPTKSMTSLHDGPIGAEEVASDMHANATTSVSGRKAEGRGGGEQGPRKLKSSLKKRRKSVVQSPDEIGPPP
ncbi:hypothetical protein JAAARDRAFT_368073 [Jaapia argillacea MUCL 33604]|uniref:Uncharacterized protein n=1 Tax=Jaapia argillacea MUCL 33604 TaxID=933084 RepID=A0A067Q831_9AGAM|nr:hypothetical protein JAAARDRAFT_368073 [Jaapia argillacea MUCL 33604]